MSVDIIRLTVPAIFKVPQVQEFLLEAAKETDFPNPLIAIDFLAHEASQPGTQVLLGFEDDKPVALTVVLLPGSPLMLHPQLVLAYNKGSRAVTSGLIREMKKFVKSFGWDRLLGMNRTAHSDEVFARAYRELGEAKKWSSTLEFHIKD